MSHFRSQKRRNNEAFFSTWQYSRVYWRDFDYDVLKHHIMTRKKRGRSESTPYNDVIIMADTETSKKYIGAPKDMDNHVCLWTISLRAYSVNIVTLYGTKPREMIECMDLLHNTMPGKRTVFYFHNWPYDKVFLQKFMYEKWGFPEKQLSTKSHYPIWTKFENDINIKDSLILSQRSLEKWSADLNVEHSKAVGSWDYDKIRNQDYKYTEEELHYAEYDTLAGVECIDTLMQQLLKDITSIPFTSTGITRAITRDIGRKNRAHEQFERMCIDTLELLQKAIRIYHGGYTHGNRYVIAELLTGLIICFDFASSYPAVMLTEKYPMEKFMQLIGEYTVKDVLDYYKKDYACMFTIQLSDVHLKDPRFPMPTIQQSKIIECINPILDNGRVLDADYILTELTEIDLYLLDKYYTYKVARITDLYVAKKDYLPRWFTDLVWKYYNEKCKLKFGDDPVAYDISKSIVNAFYGMCCQKPIPDDIIEDYEIMEYYTANVTPEEMAEKLKKYNKSRKSILSYPWGMWVTNYAMKNLFELGECAGRWYYSDTDSCYGEDWDLDKVKAYNEKALEKLRNNGYDKIEIEGHTFILGAAEMDGRYTEFKTMGAKRYACRKEDGDIKITVAGVPKKTGKKVLKNDLNNFVVGLIFPGEITGKKEHTYILRDEIYIDENGNEVGDSIDLSPSDYTLDSTENWDWLFEELLGATFSGEIPVVDDGRI